MAKIITVKVIKTFADLLRLFPVCFMVDIDTFLAEGT